jgi:dephospho-CoA kinase
VLKVAVTGGIGSGKSTVSARLAEHGAIVVDSDRLAREVVAVGSPGLAAVIERFGPSVLATDGTLDRAALATVVFSDPEARRALEGIIHPRVRARFDELAAAAPPEAVVVNDMPLLVALPVAAAFHLVIGVGADPGVRIQRLIGRGLAESDARARIAAQIDDEQRRPLTDVWLDNDGTADALVAAVDRLWNERLQPFRTLLLQGAAAPRAGAPVLVPHDPRWPADAARLLARAGRAAGGDAQRLDHVGSTAVPGLPARDVLDLQVVVPDQAAAGRVAPALARAGFVAVPGPGSDLPRPVHDDPAGRGAVYVNADPGRAVDLRVWCAADPGWRSALAFRDWLGADAAERDGYRTVKVGLAAEHAHDPDDAGYAAAKRAWFGAVGAPLRRWIERSGWLPPAVATHQQAL